MSSLFLLYLLFFLIICGSPLYVVAARIPACPEELFVQLRYQLCSLLPFQFIQLSCSRMAAFMSFFISLARWRTASSLFSLLLRDGFLKYLRSLSILYSPSLITRFFSFCIARFGSSPRLTFTVIILLFLCYSVLQSCVIKLYTSSISHCQAFVKWPGSSPDGSKDSTQKVGDKSGAVLCCKVPLRWRFGGVSGSESFPCDSPRCEMGKLRSAPMPGCCFI